MHSERAVRNEKVTQQYTPLWRCHQLSPCCLCWQVGRQPVTEESFKPVDREHCLDTVKTPRNYGYLRVHSVQAQFNNVSLYERGDTYCFCVVCLDVSTACLQDISRTPVSSSNSFSTPVKVLTTQILPTTVLATQQWGDFGTGMYFFNAYYFTLNNMLTVFVGINIYLFIYFERNSHKLLTVSFA